MDGRSSKGQAERRVNRDKVRLRVLDGAQDVVIAECHVRMRVQATKETYACGSAWRTSEVYADDNKCFGFCHDSGLSKAVTFRKHVAETCRLASIDMYYA